MTGEEIRLNYLPPNGFIVLCLEDDTTAFKLIGNTVGIEYWSTLTNDGVLLIKN